MTATPGVILDQQLHEAVPNPRDFDAAIPEELARIILRLCEKKPDDRYESAEEVAAALEVFLNP